MVRTSVDAHEQHVDPLAGTGAVDRFTRDAAELRFEDLAERVTERRSVPVDEGVGHDHEQGDDGQAADAQTAGRSGPARVEEGVTNGDEAPYEQEHVEDQQRP